MHHAFTGCHVLHSSAHGDFAVQPAFSHAPCFHTCCTFQVALCYAAVHEITLLSWAMELGHNVLSMAECHEL